MSPPVPLPQTMKQLLQPSVQSTRLILTTAPVPIPTAPDDVLIHVAAAAPCAGELLWAKNFPDSVPADKEMVPCQDLAGTVVQSSPSSSSPFKPGDRVFCRVDASRAGTAREYALAKVSELALIPEGLGWVEAAATPLSALTAWQALFVRGTLDVAGLTGEGEAVEKNKGKRVLVTGAAGGVGSWAVQLASLAGAGAVVAVCGAGKEDAVRKLGATEVVDYTQTSIEEWVAADPAAREVDFVFDVVGGKTLAGCWRAVREGGALISVNTPPDMVRPAGLEKEVGKSLFFIVEPLGSNLAEVAELIRAGKVRPTVDSVWPFEQFEKAFEKVESGHTNGKIVIKVGAEEV
ncbi:NAD(P)-binding protein [Coniochaeta ligniaria NRRL 30616]|uniref:NAD(P)-binding protein n=1 Tax=Coniochaeta ligniaria NRRL 30616 TaxID=1408157 RepID=A0A1J7J5Y2_9PEZI|nr:NAD(P)-binding protein [Coniochaeta ligniaria NRRL 30616]